MSKEFFCVSMDWGDDFYFRSHEAAKEFMWNYYTKYFNDESEKGHEDAMIELQTIGSIQGIGIIYTYEFED